MKMISRLQDLEQYGIVPLTGEACGLSMRILCDLTLRGTQLVKKAFGLPFDAQFDAAWNSKSRAGEHVGAIMLDPMEYLNLGVFALLDNGHHTVLRFYHQQGTHGVIRDLAQLVRTATQLLTNTEQPAGARAQAILVFQEEAKPLLAESRRRGSCIVSDNILYGLTGSDDDYLEQYLADARQAGWTYRSYGYQGTARDRNVHEMTGRVS